MIDATLPDIRQAWEHAYFSLLNDEPGVIDYYQRNIIHSFGNTLKAESAVFDFDLGDIGLTPTKWSKFTGQYIDVETLHAWVNNANNVKTYDSLWQFKDIPPNFGGKKAVHQWGKCLLGFSFRRQGGPPTLTLYTRAQSLGFSGVADYALSDWVARQISGRLNIPQSSIRLEIHCANFIIKMVEVLHYLQYIGRLEEFMNRDDRIGESIRYYHVYIHRDEELIKWRAARRMRTKFHNAQDGVHRSFPVENLTLKGWNLEKRTAPKRTSREASSLVLGPTRRQIEPLEIDMA